MEKKLLTILRSKILLSKPMVDGWMDGRMDGWRGGLINGMGDGWMAGPVDGWKVRKKDAANSSLFVSATSAIPINNRLQK